MVLPIGDAPNPRGTPVVTYLLIAANVAVYVVVTLPLGGVPADSSDPAFLAYVRAVSDALRGRVPTEQMLAHVSAYDLFTFTWGFRPAAPGLVPLFASMFLHGGFLHLAGNMLFLWIYGDNVEHRLGAGRYLLAYLGAGVAATAMQALAAPHSSIPMIGASGAISGVLGFYFVWFPRNQVRLLWLLPPFVMDVFEIPARVVLGFYLVADNLLPFLVARSETGVAHGAHIGGFVAGLAAAWLLDRRALGRAPREYAAAQVDASALGRDLDDGRYAEAAAEYFSMPRRRAREAVTPERGLGLADWLRAQGQPEAALTVLRRLLRDAPPGSPRAAADVAAGRILLEDLGQPASAYQYFRDALDQDPTSDVAPLARRALAAIEATQKRQIGHLHRPRAW